MTLEKFIMETSRRRQDGNVGLMVYSEMERSFVVMYARKQMSNGVSQSKISSQLGIGNSTLSTWLRPARKKTKFKRVEVKQKAKSFEIQSFSDKEKVTIVSPRGFRLEGLSLDKAAALLCELK